MFNNLKLMIKQCPKSSQPSWIVTYRENRHTCKQHCEVTPELLRSLRTLSELYDLSIVRGELLLLGGRWYVTHSGLISIANRSGCHGIHVQPVLQFCDPTACRWAFKATVFKARSCKGFVGYGDADPS